MTAAHEEVRVGALEQKTGEGAVARVLLTRRALLTGAGLAAGAVVATSLVPLSVVHAFPSSVALDVVPAASSTGAWHVDDVCGHWPPYSHAVAYGQHADAASNLACAEPFDHVLMI
jgi:hypothetical protein